MKNLVKIIFGVLAFSIVINCETRTYDEITPKIIIVQTVKYSTDVKPIIEANCISCHSPGGAASFQPWTSYDQVKNHIDIILDRIQKPLGDPLKMPQGGSLPQSSIEVLKKWKTDGLQE